MYYIPSCFLQPSLTSIPGWYWPPVAPQSQPSHTMKVWTTQNKPRLRLHSTRFPDRPTEQVWSFLRWSFLHSECPSLEPCTEHSAQCPGQRPTALMDGKISKSRLLHQHSIKLAFCIATIDRMSTVFGRFYLFNSWKTSVIEFWFGTSKNLQ